MKYFKISQKNGVFSLRIGDLLINITKVIRPPKPLKKTTKKIKKSKTAHRIRKTRRYKKFQKECKEKLEGKCWCCGSEKDLEIHHILSINEALEIGDIKSTYDVKNAVHLCSKCHTQFHLDHQIRLNEIEKDRKCKELCSVK